MPVLFGAFEDGSKVADVGLIYEYLNKANSSSVNGMPTFFSMRVLNKKETKKMFEFYESYKAMKDLFLK